MDVDSQKSAILKWLATFPPGVPADDFPSLNDGRRLSQVLHTIAGDTFSFAELPEADGASWVLRSSNLKKLIKSLRTFYNEALEKDADFDAVVDVGAAAKGEDEGRGALALAKFVLGCAVECEQKQTYVQTLMQLDVSTQTVLMGMIQEIMASTTPVQRTSETSHDLAEDAVEADNEAFRMQTQLQGELRRKDDAIKLLQDELAQIRTEQANKAKLGEEAAQAGMELERLRLELRQAEVKITDLEVSVEKWKQETEDARKQSNLLGQQKQQMESEVEQLAEEVDVLRAKEDQLSRCEAQMERMRSRLEQLSVYPKRLEEQDAKAAEYFQQVLSLEAEVKEIPTLKQKLEQYKDKAGQYEQEKVDALSEVAVKEAEVERLKRDNKEALEEKKMLEDRVDDLRAQLQVAEENVSSPTSRSEAGMFDNPMELREKVLRLEHENTVLRREKESLASAAHEAAAGANVSVMETELSSLRSQLQEASRLGVRNESLTTALQEKEAEVVRLTAEKEKIEAFTKRALKTVHEKYTSALQVVKDEAQGRQRRVEHLENKIDSIKAAQKREERLMVSAVYELGLQIMNRQIFGPDTVDAAPASST